MADTDLRAYSNHIGGVTESPLHEALKSVLSNHWAISYGARVDEVVMRGISWDVAERLERLGYRVEKANNS